MRNRKFNYRRPRVNPIQAIHDAHKVEIEQLAWELCWTFEQKVHTPEELAVVTEIYKNRILETNDRRDKALAQLE